MNVRIIPRLDIKGPNLVKGIHLEGLRVLGKPEAFARLYYEEGADELLYMDAVASLYGRNSLNQIIEKTTREIFIPFCVGGGLRSIDDIRAVLRAGADKAAVNTAAIKHPDLINVASKAFGSSTIVVSIAAQRARDGRFECFVDGGREPAGRDAHEWAIEAVERGAGELLVTSIDREGTGSGFDVELMRLLATAVPVPVVASGGAGRDGDVVEVVEKGRADAVALASILHYAAIHDIPFSSTEYAEEGNVDYRATSNAPSRLASRSIADIKMKMASAGMSVRES